MSEAQSDAVSAAPNDGAVPPFAAYVGSDPFIFVSYSHADRGVVFDDLRRLRAAGFNVWYDEGIAPGSEWSDELASAIARCERVLFYVSPASVASRVCRDEIRFAKQQQKDVLAIHLTATKLTDGLDLDVGSESKLLKYELSDAAYRRELVRALRAPSGAPRGETARAKRRHFPVVWIGVAVFAAMLISAYAYLATSKPRITAYTQLTKSQDRFAPQVSPIPIVTDGPRVYFNRFENGLLEFRSVPMRGGQSTSLETPFKNGFISGITPDYGELVVASPTPTSDDARWLWPPSGGTPRRLDIHAHDLTWSNDGSLMVFGTNELFVAKADGSEPRKIVDAPGVVAWIRVSSDNARVRFTSMQVDRTFSSLWEVSIDGTHLRPLLEGWNNPPNECCGTWTPDGRYYVFQAKRGGHWQLWALRDGGFLPGSSVDPIELTPRTMEFVYPTVSPDGRKIVAIGWQLAGELMRYDAAAKQWVPHSIGRSAEWLAYSRDEAWIAYVSYPGAELWRSRADGSDACMLASASAHAAGPRWSPDGESIVFTDVLSERAMVVAARCGSTPRPVSRVERRDCCATWAPNGRTVSLATESGIRLADVDSGSESPLEDSESLVNPQWWDDGRYISATASDGTVKRFDFETRVWSTIGHADPPFLHRPSPDGQYVWITSMRIAQQPTGDQQFLEMSRMRVSDGRVEPIASLAGQSMVWGTRGLWMGVTPDGSPLYLRDVGVYRIYALDFEP